MHHLVGLSEVAKMLGVSRQRADQLVRQVGFPAPTAELDGGRIWETQAIEQWAGRRSRTVSAVLTVQARRAGDTKWMTWAGSQIAGRVASFLEVLEKAEACSCPPRDIKWPGGSLQEMMDAGVAPLDVDAFLSEIRGVGSVHFAYTARAKPVGDEWEVTIAGVPAATFTHPDPTEDLVRQQLAEVLDRPRDSFSATLVRDFVGLAK